MTTLELRIALKAGGFAPIPCAGKSPLLAEWQSKANVTVEEISRWGGSNTGILCSDVPGCDMDIDHSDAVACVADLARDWFDGRGVIPIRFGRLPRRALLFRTNQPFKKFVQWFKAPDGSLHKIEMLGDGQQVIVDGIHPDTGNRYSWHAGICPWHLKRADLVEITETEAHEFIELAADTLKEQFGFERAEPPKSAGGNGHINDAAVPADPIEALAALSPAAGTVNATYCHVIPELLRRGEHPDDVLKQVVDAAMAAAEREGLTWSRADEVKRVVRTILSEYRNMRVLLRDYDPATGTVPSMDPGAAERPTS